MVPSTCPDFRNQVKKGNGAPGSGGGGVADTKRWEVTWPVQETSLFAKARKVPQECRAEA